MLVTYGSREVCDLLLAPLLDRRVSRSRRGMHALSYAKYERGVIQALTEAGFDEAAVRVELKKLRDAAAAVNRSVDTIVEMCDKRAKRLLRAENRRTTPPTAEPVADGTLTTFTKLMGIPDATTRAAAEEV